MPNQAEAALAALKKENLIEVTRDIIDIPSREGSEKGVADYLIDRFHRKGLQVITQEVEPDRYNVIAVLKGTGGGPTLMYCGHMDTPWAGDEEGIDELGPGYKPPSYMEGDWICGMGAYNMKSGLATSIAAVEALKAAEVRLKGDVMVACVVGETCHHQVGRYQGARYRGGGIGATHMVARGITADMCVIPEPTTNKISAGSGGYVHLEIKTRGNPGATYVRGGSSKAGVKPAVDAIGKMFGVAAAIKEWAPGYVASNKYRGEEAANATIIAVEGGFPWRPSKLAPFCRLYLELVTTPGMHPGDVIAQVEDLLAKCRKKDKDLNVELNVVAITQGSEIETNSFVIKALSEAHHKVHNNTPEVTFDTWYADTTPLTRYGIPTVCYGSQGRAMTGGENYYPVQGEAAHVDDLMDGAKVFVHMAVDVCSKDRAGMVKDRKRQGTVVY